MKSFICSCVNPDFESLEVKDTNEFSDLIDNSENIEESEFLNSCEIDSSLKNAIEEYPDDFEFYKNGGIMFYTHSMIEHFYK